MVYPSIMHNWKSFLTLYAGLIVCLSKPILTCCECSASDAELEARWQSITNSRNPRNTIEIMVGTLGKSTSRVKQQQTDSNDCVIAHWMYPDENVALDRYATYGATTLNLPFNGPAMVICSLHSAIEYANNIPSNVEVVIYLARGTYHIGHHNTGPLPWIRRSMSIIGATENGWLDLNQDHPPLHSFSCFNERAAIDGGYDKVFKKNKSSYQPLTNSHVQLPRIGVKYHLTTVLKGSGRSTKGTEGIFRIQHPLSPRSLEDTPYTDSRRHAGFNIRDEKIPHDNDGISSSYSSSSLDGTYFDREGKDQVSSSSNPYITVHLENLAFIGGSHPRGGAIFVSNDVEAEEAVNMGSLKLGRQQTLALRQRTITSYSQMLTDLLSLSTSWSLVKVVDFMILPFQRFSPSTSGLDQEDRETVPSSSSSDIKKQSTKQSTKQSKTIQTLAPPHLQRRMLVEEGGLDVVDVQRKKFLRENNEDHMLHVYNCDFIGNVASFGGAIYNGNGALNLTFSSLVGNNAKLCGGAVYLVNGFSRFNMHAATGTMNSDRCAIISQISAPHDPIGWVPNLNHLHPIVKKKKNDGVRETMATPSFAGQTSPSSSSNDNHAVSSADHSEVAGFIGLGDPVSDEWCQLNNVASFQHHHHPPPPGYSSFSPHKNNGFFKFSFLSEVIIFSSILLLFIFLMMSQMMSPKNETRKVKKISLAKVKATQSYSIKLILLKIHQFLGILIDKFDKDVDEGGQVHGAHTTRGKNGREIHDKKVKQKT